MTGIIARLLANLLVGACLFAPAVFFFSLAALLGLLPVFARFLRICLRALLILSYRLYLIILTLVAPLVERWVGVDPLLGWPRLVATLTLSLIIGMVVLALTPLTATAISLGLIVVHGLAVGLAWDEIAAPGGLQLGARLR
jgi:hypothetical protein